MLTGTKIEENDGLSHNICRSWGTKNEEQREENVAQACAPTKTRAPLFATPHPPSAILPSPPKPAQDPTNGHNDYTSINDTNPKSTDHSFNTQTQWNLHCYHIKSKNRRQNHQQLFLLLVFVIPR